MLDPVDHRVVVDTSAALDGSKAHTIDIQGQAVPFDLSGVAFGGVGFDKLASAALAAVVLLAATVTIFSDLSGVTLRTLHPSIMQRLHIS